MRYVTGLVAAGLMALALAACETAEGLGKDIQSAGEAIEKGAED